MACSPDVLRDIPLFSNLDDDELRVLAGQVELRQFPARQRIFRLGDPAERAYIVVSGSVRVIIIDEDHQEILLHQPGPGEFFGFASMLEQTPAPGRSHRGRRHQPASKSIATICMVLFQQKPHSIIDILAFLGRQLHDAHQIARNRSLPPTRRNH